MFWVAVRGFDDGRAISLGELQQLDAEAVGVHGYPTQGEAEAKPNELNAVNYLFIEGDFSPTPAQAVASGAKGAANAAAKGAGDASGLSGLENALTSKNTWLRAAKVIVGSVLIIVGLARITGADKAVTTAAEGALP